jgi:hypothetical protein
VSRLSFFYKCPKFIHLGLSELSVSDEVGRYFLSMMPSPLHPTLDGIFVKGGCPTSRSDATLFHDHRQGIQDSLVVGSKPIEESPLRVGEGVATRLAVIELGLVWAWVSEADNLSMSYIPIQFTVGMGAAEAFW